MDELLRMYNASYVDDNAVAAFAAHIEQAIHHSVMSAFEVFGHDPNQGDCLQATKWEPEVTETFLLLGFRINTHDMTVSWPLYKREDLHSQLVDILKRCPCCVSPREMAKIVGIVRSASEIAPWGNFLSFNLQNALTQPSGQECFLRQTKLVDTLPYLSIAGGSCYDSSNVGNITGT
ncbi:unnamed protein product [Cylindrotheca closterium]|uniref:Uncharacterized protein n=1 Tax=Cylindrotheca closterium TaxID=2856 RepID=A0AAD2JJ36_9STRA|nr:unnamed protein product [Cylindrotheca closterium]